MGQHSSKASTEATLEVPPADTTSIRTGHQSSSSVISVPRSMFTQCKHKLSRIELYSLHQTFDELKTVQSDQFECIEVKEFLVSDLFTIVSRMLALSLFHKGASGFTTID